MPQVCLCSSLLSRQRNWGDAEGLLLDLYSSFLPSFLLFSLPSFSPSIGNGHHHFLLSPNNKQFCRAQLQRLMKSTSELRKPESKAANSRDKAMKTPLDSRSRAQAGPQRPCFSYPCSLWLTAFGWPFFLLCEDSYH